MICVFFKKALVIVSALLISSAVMVATAQTRTVKGTVKDASGVPVIGATVLVDGTSVGTSTDVDGNWSLSVNDNDGALTASCIGYVSSTVALGGRSVVDFVLNEDTQMLEDVVVVGYGVQKKSDVTGSISSVEGGALSNRSVENVQQALQGKVSGVQVYSGSGAPGSDPQIRIRGFSSNSSGASNPLYVVDGLKVSSIAYLDPANIESMEVLKDGASAAIYGAEAGNGVVLITTKSGKKGDGKIFYDMSYGFQKLARKADMMNANEYVGYQTAAGNGTAMSAWDGKIDNDWHDTLYGETGHIQRHSVGFDAANDKGSLYAALTYLKNDGMYYGDKDYMKRLTFQLNASYQIKPWLKFYSNNSIELVRYSKTGDGINKTWYNSPYKYDPLTPAFYPKDNLPQYMKDLIAAKGDEVFMKNENGDYAAIPNYAKDTTNPMTWYYSQDSRHKDFNVRGITALDFTPFKGFTFTSRIGYTLNSGDYRYYGVPVYFSISPRTNPEYQAQTSTGYGYEWENFINYNVTLKKHNIYAMAGMSYRYSWSNFTKGTTDKFTNMADNFKYLNFSSSDAQDTVGGEEFESSSISYFGRVGYSYDNRYSIQASFRADAYDSSKLASESRWGYFPSVSAGWTISNEPFMKNVSPHALSFLKLRASYGVNGNVNVLSGYRYASSLGSGMSYPIGGGVISSITPSDVLANPSLKWETSKQVDVGIDARFLGDRLSATLDFYDKNTTGQLIAMTPPLSSGSNRVTRNVGKINNRGFELELGWKDTVGDFSYSVTGNFATLHNEVVDMGGNPKIFDGRIVCFDKGQPVWSYYGYRYDGVNKETGEAIYYDKDGNGTIDEKDRVFFGSAIPDVEYGLTFNAEWKGIDFTIFGSGTAGGELFFNSINPEANRLAEFYNDSWSVKGASAKYPKPASYSDTFMDSSSMLMFNGSYFKIKQIALGYSLPSKILKKAFISRLRVFVSLDNVWCFTKYPGMDPEIISATGTMGLDNGEYPLPRTFTLGLNLSF